MRVYRGNWGTRQVTVNGRPLPMCLDIRSHSPDGFCWGYGGSGPAQLALAVMVNEYGRDLERHPLKYQDVKWWIVAALAFADFEFTSASFRGQVEQLAASLAEREPEPET